MISLYKLVQYPNPNSNVKIEKAIIRLLLTEWQGIMGENPQWNEGNQNKTSFVLFDGETAVCHVAVVSKYIEHKAVRYKVAGICEVVTRREYRHKRLAWQLLTRAREYIVAAGVDFSVLTCNPSLVQLYCSSGWTLEKKGSLIGGTRQKPFRSDHLGLSTLLSLHSQKARQNSSSILGSDIFLDLGENKLW